MKRVILFCLMAIIAIATAIIAADHVDAPAVGSLATGSGDTDITDFYAFESPSNKQQLCFRLQCTRLDCTVSISRFELQRGCDV